MSSLSNLLITLYIHILNLITLIVSIIPFLQILAFILQLFLRIQIYCLRFLIDAPLNLICLFASRQDEYAADEYAVVCGLGEPLANALIKIEESNFNVNMSQSFFQNLKSTHPATEKRLKNIAKKQFELFDNN